MSAAQLILALNAGSSSLKCALYEVHDGAAVEAGRSEAEINGPAADAAAVAQLLDWAAGLRPDGALAGVGHRVVHGGLHFHNPVLINPPTWRALKELEPLAPLHQPQSLAAVAAVSNLRPDLPQVACFDTGFHHTMPEVAARFGLPRALHDLGVRRYGFHGLSYAYIAERLRALDPALAAGKVVVAHLGSGASLCAMQDGRSVDTTMGFSPLDGLVMSTRCGSLDPAVVLFLQSEGRLTPDKVQDLLYRHAGLLGVSGLSGDMRTLLESDAREAAQAVELFVHQAGREAAAMAAALGGLDGVVFTAGIGEHSAAIRAKICEKLAWLGVELDPDANAKGGEARISAPGSRTAAWVMPTDEERVIAAQTLSCLP